MSELPKISSAMLVLTHACNLACRYCFVQQSPSRMTLETAKRAAEFLMENAALSGHTPEINFFGGEPLLLWDSVIKPLTLWLREEVKVPFMLSMTSNCTLLDDERLEFMKKHNIGLLFSIDGAEATQDYNRPFHDGRGSFNTLAPMIPRILAQYPGMCLRMTAIPQTCGRLFENIMWGESEGYKNFFVVPNVFEHWSDAARGKLSREMRRYSDYYVYKCRQNESPLSFSTFEDALRDIRAINSAEEALEDRALPKCKAAGKCGLGASRFASIHPNGNIYGCQEMTSNEGGESIFYIGSLDSGVSDERRRALMRAFSAERARGDNCDNCGYNRVCDGGCVANNYIATGKLQQLPEVFCWWRRLVLDEAVRVMQTLGREKNEAFKRRWEGKA